LADNRRVGGGGLLEASTPGIELDQKQGRIYFGGSNGRFDHCTDLGRVDFDTVTEVDPDILQRKREDTEIREGHTYIYESNIYEANQRTKFTGFDVRYAKIFIERVDVADIPTRLKLNPDHIRAGERLSVSYHPGSADLHGARELSLYWATYDADGKSLVKIAPTQARELPGVGEIAEFPAAARGTEGGEFELGRKRCRTMKMKPEPNGYWQCELDISPEARTLAMIFVDDVERTSAGGIKTFPVTTK
jgi:hypothetical protein